MRQLSKLKKMLRKLNATQRMSGIPRDIEFFERHFKSRSVCFTVKALTVTTKSMTIYL
jgi:hypothetical protein